MHLGLNASLLYDASLRGWNRYAINLIMALADLGAHISLYSHRPLHDNHLSRLRSGRVAIRIAPRMPYWAFEQIWLPRQLRIDKVEVFHAPFHFGLALLAPCPQVITLHDAIGDAYREARGSLRERIGIAPIKAALLQSASKMAADAVITVSDYSRSDLIKHLKISADRITVIYEAADPVFSDRRSPAATQATLARHGVVGDYVFYVGGLEDRKNLPFLLRAFGRAALGPVKLVIGGGQESDREQLSAYARSLGVGHDVCFLGTLTDDDLPSLYQRALCFVYPSSYEGFGLQLCEAMSSGCPVLASEATSLPEILGDGGEVFSLIDEDELVELLQRCASDPVWRDSLVARAEKRARQFSWRRAAEQTMDVYRRLLSR